MYILYTYIALRKDIFIYVALPHTCFLIEGNEIDHEALLYLDFETVKELVPKIGPRTKLWQKLKTYQALNRMPIIIEEQVADLPSGSNVGSNIVSFILHCYPEFEHRFFMHP